MGIQSADVLYPVNTTVVDSGTGIDIRLLDSAEAGAVDNTQTVTATHTQDNQVRVFDPASTNNTNRLITDNQAEGWGLRLADDMTPTDDTNCNAYLLAQTLTVNVRVTINQAGGTYGAGGSYAPFWGAALFRYNPSTDAGVLIANGSNNSASWNIGALGDLGTFKLVAISIVIAAGVEFAAGEILMIQFGVGTVTIPNPTLGTATWTYTLSVDHADTNITWEAGKPLCALCHTVGTLTGSAAVDADAAIIMPTVGAITGSASLLSDVSAFGATGFTVTGAAALSGVAAGLALTTATIEGSATVEADAGAIIGTEFTIDTGAAGGGNTYPRSRVVNATS